MKMKRILAVVLAAMLILTCCGISAMASGTKTFTTTGKARMRSGPGLSYSKVQTLPKGKSFKATDYETDERGVTWYFGSYNGKTGWVSGKNLTSGSVKPSKKTAKPTAAPTPRPIDWSGFTDAGYYVTVTANSLNMRYNPSTDYSVIAAYKNGDVLYAKRTNGNWVEVLDEATDRLGYMSSKYLAKVETAEATATPDPELDVQTEGALNSMEELQAAFPNAVLIDAPAGAQNVSYGWTYLEDLDEAVARVYFDVDGISYTLSEAPAAYAEEASDIDEVETAQDVDDYNAQNTGSIQLTISDDYTTAVAFLYSTANSMQYTLSGPAANDGALVLSLAQQIFPAA